MPSYPPEHEQRGPWRRLWAAVQPDLDAHPVAAGALGEYAFVLQQQGSDAAERAFPDVAAHVGSGCARCAADLAEFPFPFEPQPESIVRRVLATLVASPPLRQLAATRGPGEPTVRTYTAGDLSVSISTLAELPRTQESAGSVVVEGLIAATDPGARPLELAGVSVRFSQPDGPTYASVIDERGNFGFDDVAPGRYELEVRLEDHTVVVEDLFVGAEGGDPR